MVSNRCSRSAVTLLIALAVASSGSALGPGAPLLELLGTVEIPDGELDGARIGGLSGITYDQERDRYYAISDDRARYGPVRFFTLTIDLADGRLDDGDVTVVAMTPLVKNDGEAYARGEVDMESIAYSDGSLLISSEGHTQPYLRRFGLDGRLRGGLAVPAYYEPRDDRTKGSQGIRDNQAFESITVVPGTTLVVTAIENALIQDGPAADINIASPVRTLVIDSRTGEAVAEHGYLVEPVGLGPVADGAARVNGLVDLLALSRTRLLALERAWAEGCDASIRLYCLDLETASDLSGVPSLAAFSPGEITWVSRRPVVALEELGVPLDNFEGMSIGPRLDDGRDVLIFISDNNFSSSQHTYLVAFALRRAQCCPTQQPSIARIQGAGHWSPLAGTPVSEVRGIVTARLAGSGFWMQDPRPDNNPDTSDGIFVGLADSVEAPLAGDLVLVDGTVQEPAYPGQLPVTSLVASSLRIVARGAPLPPPVYLGSQGCSLPDRIIDDDQLQAFEPEQDAIDRFESLEGMWVVVQDPVVVGPTTSYGETAVLADGGAAATKRTDRGGILLGAQDSNPERLILSDLLSRSARDLEVGDQLRGPVTGVLHYSYGRYKLLAEQIPPAPGTHTLTAETTELTGDDHRITVATFNVENLAADADQEKLHRVAGVVTRHLRSPDILGLQEIQDNNGKIDDGVVSANETLNRLVTAIEDQGGPRYQAVQIDPENNGDGGMPGANIRTVFLVNPARVSARLRGDGPRPTAEVEAGPHLSASPGRIAPDHPAFAADPAIARDGVRKSLALEVEFQGRTIFLINNHWSSKRGDDSLFGSNQPPRRASEQRRILQASVINTFVRQLLTHAPTARVIVLGDLNEHEFRPPLATVADGALHDLIEQVPAGQRYTYVYAGNSQVLDHILVSDRLLPDAEVDIVHVNAEQPASSRASDHDPVVARLVIH